MWGGGEDNFLIVSKFPFRKKSPCKHYLIFILISKSLASLGQYGEDLEVGMKTWECLQE